MGEKRKSGGFISFASIIATTLCIVFFTMCTWAARDKGGLISIIMAKDSSVFVGGVVNQEVMQKMVDQTIEYFTEVIGEDPSIAYEYIFGGPGNITSSTKILIKYNPKTPETTRKPMIDALKKGLGYMLHYTFPQSNILVVGDEGTASSTDTVVVDSLGTNLKYAIKDLYVNTDYIIYCPSAWGTSAPCGVDMCLNLMTTSIVGVGGATLNNLYNFVFDTTFPSLSVLNYHPIFNGDNGKTVLYMMDLISYSGTGSATDLHPGYKIFATDNITVCDWKGIRFLKDSVNAITDAQALAGRKVCSLSVYPIDLGVVNEGQMLEVEIGPPWTTGIKKQVNNNHALQVKVISNQTQTIFRLPKAAGNKAQIAIYDIQGRKVWACTSMENTIIWNNNDLKGKKVSGGIYVYQLTAGGIKARGKTAIKR